MQWRYWNKHKTSNMGVQRHPGDAKWLTKILRVTKIRKLGAKCSKTHLQLQTSLIPKFSWDDTPDPVKRGGRGRRERERRGKRERGVLRHGCWEWTPLTAKSVAERRHVAWAILMSKRIRQNAESDKFLFAGWTGAVPRTTMGRHS